MVKMSLRLHDLISHIHSHPGTSLSSYIEVCEILDILRRNRFNLYCIATKQPAIVDWDNRLSIPYHDYQERKEH